jgi:hypothetical protein
MPNKTYIVQGRGTGVSWKDCSKPLNILDAHVKEKDIWDNGMMSDTCGEMSDWLRVVPVEDANCRY